MKDIKYIAFASFATNSWSFTETQNTKMQ